VPCLPSYDEGVAAALLNGLLGDIDGLASAIVGLLTNPPLSAKFGNDGFTDIERFHSIDHVCLLQKSLTRKMTRRIQI
jgi:hypothetical protein